jgi:nitroreductase
MTENGGSETALARAEGLDTVIDVSDSALSAPRPDSRAASLRPGVSVDRLEVVDEPTAAPSTRTVPGSVMLVGSSGGHLAQLLMVADLWDSRRRSYVTFDTTDAQSLLVGEQVTWAHHPTTRNVRNLLRNSVLAVRELRRRRPDVVVSTGAGVAFPFFLAARAMRIPTVYVEVYDRLDSPTLTGRLCRPLASVFCVQWAEQVEFYKGAELVGSLL